ncbi:MAG TPA: hypothetical protein VIG06_10315, partial [Kofleriaceae bacterium]
MIGFGSRLAAGVALAAAAAVLASPLTAEGQKKKKKEEAVKPGTPACGIAFLPFVEGTEWTYKYFAPENAEPPPGTLHVDPPETLTVKVDKVTPSADGATVTVTESYRKVTATHDLTCTKDALQIPIDSFFFNGEPGGGIALKIDKVDRKGDSFLLKGGLKENTFQEFRAVATRVPTEKSGAAIPPAALEVERKMTVKGKEPTESDLGEHKTAIRVDIELTGRAALDTQKDKPLNMAT